MESDSKSRKIVPELSSLIEDRDGFCCRTGGKKPPYSWVTKGDMLKVMYDHKYNLIIFSLDLYRETTRLTMTLQICSLSFSTLSSCPVLMPSIPKPLALGWLSQ
jgi:hypothetical protein